MQQYIRRAPLVSLLLLISLCVSACGEVPASSLDHAYYMMGDVAKGTYTRTIFSGSNF